MTPPGPVLTIKVLWIETCMNRTVVRGVNQGLLYFGFKGLAHGIKVEINNN